MAVPLKIRKILATYSEEESLRARKELAGFISSWLNDERAHGKMKELAKVLGWAYNSMQSRLDPESPNFASLPALHSATRRVAYYVEKGSVAPAGYPAKKSK